MSPSDHRAGGALRPVPRAWCAMLAVVTLAATGPGCGADTPAAADATPGPADAATADAGERDALPAPGFRAEVLATSTFTAVDRTFTTTLARITRPDGERTYVQWVPSDLPSPRPAIVVTRPYSGIDWTGEDVDQRWAQAQAVTGTLYRDVDGPGYDGEAVILYEPYPVDAGNRDAVPHLVNDLSVLLVFGRFYTGGSARDDIEDARAAMWFLAEQDSVDRTRVATLGGSLGGFMALHAAAHADARLAVIATVADFAPSDLAAWIPYSQTRLGMAAGFVAPYVRRIYSVTGGPPDADGADYRGLGLDALCGRIPAATLLLHDQHDTLVPIGQSQALRARCGADAIYWYRDGDVDPEVVDHGAMTREPSPPSMELYGHSYLHLRLAPLEQQVVERYSRAALVEHLTTVRDGLARGEDIGFAAPRLLELCDPRLRLINDLGFTVTGAEAVARAINEVFGTHHSELTIGPALARGFPAVLEEP